MSLAGCAQGPAPLQTASIAKTEDLGGPDPDRQARLCQRATVEIDSYVAEIAKHKLAHEAELKKPPANLVQVWERSFGTSEGGTVASGLIAEQRQRIAGLNRQLASQNCATVDVEAALAAAKPRPQ